MSDNEEPQDAPVAGPLLHSLDGKPAPDGLREALLKLAPLPAGQLTAFGELLQSSLEVMAEDQLDLRIVRLCRKAELDPEQLAPPIKAARLLLRTGAALAVTQDELRDDLAALCPGEPNVAETLLPLYSEAYAGVREEIIMQALAAHGRVLAGLDWRIDTIGSSNAGRKLGVPVAMLTMHYRDRQQTGSFTIQLTPEMVNQIREVCNELLAH